MSNQLTDKNFWANYWESKPDLVLFIKSNYLFHEHLQEIIQVDKPTTAIELGGFPGYYSIFLKKYFAIKTTLLDYFVHRDILVQVLEKNGLRADEIAIIEADLYSYEPQELYDLTLSCGLIEHFKDTKEILEHHVKFLKPGGTLFVTLPNFKGVNGFVQKVFDFENYQKHYIPSMDLVLLSKVCYGLGLKNVSVNYTGHFCVWLENRDQKPWFVRALVRVIWYIGKIVTKLIPFDSKLLSPYIVIKAQKSS